MMDDIKPKKQVNEMQFLRFFLNKTGRCLWPQRIMTSEWILLIPGSLERVYDLLFRTYKIFKIESVVVILSYKNESLWFSKMINMRRNASQTTKIGQNHLKIKVILMVLGDINVHWA